MARYALPVSQLAASVASAATAVAVSLALASSGWGAWVLSFTLVAGILPSVLLAPLLAPLLETRKLPRLTAILQGIEAFVLLCAAVSPSPPVLLTMAVLTGITSCLTAPALMALAQGAGELSARGFARMDTARMLGFFVGPVIGGFLYDLTSVSIVILTEALILVSVATVVFRTPVRSHDNSDSPQRSWYERISEVPSLFFRDPFVRRSIVVLATGVVFTAVYSVSNVLLATQVLGLSGVGYALIIQAFVIGRILGSRVGAHVTRDNCASWLVSGGIAMGVGLIISGIFPHPVPVGIGFFISGVSNAVQVAAIRMVFVRVLPERLMPKALSSLGSVNNAAMVVGLIAATPLIDIVGPSMALVISGLGTTGVAFLSLFFRKFSSPATESSTITYE